MSDSLGLSGLRTELEEEGRFSGPGAGETVKEEIIPLEMSAVKRTERAEWA